MEQDKAKLEFVKAFNKCQGLLAPVKADSTNPHFKSKYASLEAVLSAVQPFTEAGFIFLQGGVDISGKPYLRTKMIHKDGWEEVFDYPLIADNNPQHLAGASTYARRYSICALVGLCVDDDDGNAAAGTTLERKAYVPSDAPKRTTESAPQPTGESDIEVGIPEDVDTKQGESAKGPYTKFTVKMGGKYLSTFDEIQGQLLIAASQQKKEVRIGYKKSGKYFNIVKVFMDGKAVEHEAEIEPIPF